MNSGRYQGGHSHSHYDESHHAYALEIKTQRIWSYEDDMYIHRLIRDNTDGRLVELPSLSSTLTTSAKDDATDSTEGGIGIAGGGGVKKGPDAKEEESMSKLEAYSIEIADVLTVQLDSQREFYQDEIEVLKRKWEESKGENLVVSEARGENERRIKELMGELEKERERWKKEKEVSTKVAIEEESRRKKERVEAVKSRRELEKALEEEKAVTASLTANLSHLRIEVGKRDQETAQVRAEVDDLREQMRDVMFVSVPPLHRHDDTDRVEEQVRTFSKRFDSGARRSERNGRRQRLRPPTTSTTRSYAESKEEEALKCCTFDRNFIF